MNRVIVAAAVAPLMREPNPRSEVVSQLIIGDTARIGERRGDWFALTRAIDGYSGWSHRGYLREASDEDAERWRSVALYLADGAVLHNPDGERFSLPLLARVAPEGQGWELPSGWRGTLVTGSILQAPEFERRSRAERTIDWVVGRFSGAPYLWGGVTPWGVDCSGLIQAAFAARGVLLPRDSADQARAGKAVSRDSIATGDLLFFSDNGDKITHVALAGEEDFIVHSTMACGGFVVENWTAGHRAWKLRDQLVEVRRIADSSTTDGEGS
ncbi:MAG: C40 family peptidase [Gemmatimonadota bacterium]